MPRRQPPAESRASISNSDTQSSSRKRTREDEDDTATLPCGHCRARKVRCDRQQPGCSNCRKAQVPCDYSNSPSRVYQVKELLDAFSSVTSRLDGIEGSVAGMMDLIKRAAPHLPGLTGEVIQPAENGNGLVEEEELPQGFPAAVSLFKSIHGRLSRALDGPRHSGDWWTLAQRKPPMRCVMKQQLILFPFSGGCLEFEVTSDGQPIEAPPRHHAESCVRIYLHTINEFTPIFDKANLPDALAFYYDSPLCQQTPAQALMFSNIHLLTITLTVRSGQRCLDETERLSMDLDQVRWLLQNCDRALHDLGAFSNPSLDNLRALLTLALVCQEYYSSIAFSRVCQAVTRLVRDIGLHQTRIPIIGSWNDISEEARLFWVAYGLDKRMVFLSGVPSDLYLFNCSLPLLSCGTGQTQQEFNGAFNQLFAIWEDIYRSLYSFRSTSMVEPDGENHVRRLTGALRRWKEKHDLLLGELPGQAYHLFVAQIELRYASLVTEILVQRRDTTLSAEQRHRDLSRKALMLIKDVPKDRVDILGRMFRNYPMIAFHELFTYVMIAEMSEMASNADLLRETSQLLVLFRDPNFPESYYNKLYAGFTWCLDQLDLLQDAMQKITAPTGGKCPELDMLVTIGSSPQTPMAIWDAIEESQMRNPPSPDSFFDTGLLPSL
ncbi:hypothetical protein BJX99DRAFT_225874 [Aspergillus californicus]